MFLAQFAHALLRCALGGIFICLGCRHLFRDRASLEAAVRKYRPHFARLGVYALGILETLFGSLLVIGAFTQIAAFAVMTLSVKRLILYRRAYPGVPPPLFYILALAASLSLFITGAGALAFDLPL